MKNSFKKIILFFSVVPIAASIPAFGMMRLARPASRLAARAGMQRTHALSMRHQLSKPAPMVLAQPSMLARHNLVRKAQLLKPMHAFRDQSSRSRWLLGVTAGCAAVALAQQAACEEEKPTSAVEPKPWAAVEEKYRKMLEEEERALSKEFFDLEGVSEEERNKHNYSLTNYFLNCCTLDQNNFKTPQTTEPVSLSFSKLIINLCKINGIDTSTIHIINDTEAPASMAISGSAIKKQLWFKINEELIQGDPSSSKQFKNLFEANVLHELAHYFNNDVFINQMLPPIPFTTRLFFPDYVRKLKAWQFRLSRFKEKRADISAGLTHPRYARALAQWFKTSHEEANGFQDPESTHPSHKKRYIYLKKLYQEMMACIPEHERGKYA